MEIKELFLRMNALAPERYQSSWDNCGVQIAGTLQDVSKVAVALEPTVKCMTECLEWGAEAVITHHPLYMQPKAPNGESVYMDILRLFIQRGAWLYAAHTSLDTAPNGPAYWLGEALKLKEKQLVETVLEEDGRPIGFGEVGALPEPLPWAECVKTLEEALFSRIPRGVWSMSGPRPDVVTKVAYCGGSGSSMMEQAFALGAEVFITGDMKYHPAVDASHGTGMVVDAGHFLLEEEMMRLLAGTLREELAGSAAEVRFFKGEEPFTFHVQGGCSE